MGVLHRLLDLARHLALGAGDVEGLVHGLVPRLLLGGDVDRGLGGLAVLARTGVGVHDLARARGVEARRGIGYRVGGRAVPALAVAVARVGSIGRRGRVARRIAVAVPGGGRLAGRHCRRVGGWRAAVVAGIVVLGLEALVRLLDAHAVPGVRPGRQREARVANERVGDELRGPLPTRRVSLAPAGVVLERTGHDHARHRGLDEVRGGLRDPPGRVADLVPVGRERLAGRIRAQRKPQHEAPEEGLLAQELRHAVADPQRRFGEHAGGHHAASRTGTSTCAAAGAK